MSPLIFEWLGDAMRPLPRARKEADARFVIGEQYVLEPIEMRSWVSHRHQFAWLKEAWLQLPEDLADLYPSPEHLRKRALIDAGYYTETITDAGSDASARRVAAMARGLDEFALVIARGPLVIVRRAMTQRMIGEGAPNRKKFGEMKNAVIEVVSNLIGVTPEELKRQAGKAA